MTFYPNMANNSPSRVRARAIETRAVTLRSRGFSYDEIAEQMGINRDMVARAVRRGMNAWKKECKEAAAQVMDLELMRLDQLFLAAHQLAVAGSMEAVNTCLKIMERRAKFLGLDAAQKQQIQTGPADANLSHLSIEKLNEIEKMLETEGAEMVEAEDDGEIDYGSSAQLTIPSEEA